MIINFPFPTDYQAKTYLEIKEFLKQMELVIHHAQKAVENSEKDGIILSEDSYVIFTHPSLENLEKEEKLKDFTDNYFEELQHIELKIVLE